MFYLLRYAEPIFLRISDEILHWCFLSYMYFRMYLRVRRTLGRAQGSFTGKTRAKNFFATLGVDIHWNQKRVFTKIRQK